jgi:5-methylcytosine-specific restriction endonuclease McrA
MKKRNLKDQILELKAQGKTHKEIAKLLECSATAVYYHASPNGKTVANTARAKWRDSRPLFDKVKFFKRTFGKSVIVEDFKPGDLLRKTDGKCYLTGRELDLSDRRNFSLDHIISRAKGGDNTLENCGLTCREANQAKSDLTFEEFLKLCYDVCVYHKLFENPPLNITEAKEDQ